jgi:anti-sigma regulatory factor (Ser/Thr protein kinase)
LLPPQNMSAKRDERAAQRLPERIPGGDHEETMEHRVPFELIPEAASQARAVVNGDLGRAVPGKVLEDATLLVSELVTNAVRHASQAGIPEVELRLKVEPERVRVVVSDPGEGFDATPRLPTASETSGWGLYLVDRIADRWGVITKDRNEVWFEIDVDG